jgi:superfamily II DNA/RNA helicase
VKTVCSFEELNLSQELIDTLNGMGFESATNVQSKTIAPILNSQDIFVQAKTGSGKTGSFAIPIMELLNSSENPAEMFFVLSPTRELAQQTYSLFEKLCEPFQIKATCVIGGESIERQKQLISEGTQVLVATPGRLNDLINQKVVDPTLCRGLVMDEADRLFDMGFKADIEMVFKKIPKSRQLIMVSATNNMDVLNIAYKYHSHPTEIKIDVDEVVVDKIDHRMVMMAKQEKMSVLVNLLNKNKDTYAMVFCNTQYQTHFVAEWLRQLGFKAMPISGRLPQNKRSKLMADFRDRETTILVCTDVAARGLDIEDLTLVINYDLPSEASNYVHRVGRTGRAGKQGVAVSFCAHEDCDHFDAIAELVGNIPQLDLEDSDFKAELGRAPKIDRKTLRLVEDQYGRERSARSHRDKNQKRDKSTTRRDEGREIRKKDDQMEQTIERRPRNSRDSRGTRPTEPPPVKIPIIPYIPLAEKYWCFNSWDKFKLPKPFTKIHLYYGTPIHLNGKSELEAAREALKKELLKGEQVISESTMTRR